MMPMNLELADEITELRSVIYKAFSLLKCERDDEAFSVLAHVLGYTDTNSDSSVNWCDERDRLRSEVANLEMELENVCPELDRLRDDIEYMRDEYNPFHRKCTICLYKKDQLVKQCQLHIIAEQLKLKLAAYQGYHFMCAPADACLTGKRCLRHTIVASDVVPVAVKLSEPYPASNDTPAVMDEIRAIEIAEQYIDQDLPGDTFQEAEGWLFDEVDGYPISQPQSGFWAGYLASIIYDHMTRSREFHQ